MFPFEDEDDKRRQEYLYKQSRRKEQVSRIMETCPDPQPSPKQIGWLLGHGVSFLQLIGKDRLQISDIITRMKKEIDKGIKKKKMDFYEIFLLDFMYRNYGLKTLKQAKEEQEMLDSLSGTHLDNPTA